MKAAVEGSYYEWLVESTVAECNRKDKIEKVVDSLQENIPRELQEIHYRFLEKEHNRVQKIKDDEAEKTRKFEADRKERREKRHLMRVARTKRKLKEEIESKIFAKRTIEPDVFALKPIDFMDNDSEPKKFRTYGGLLYELWSVLSYSRWYFYKRAETPMEKFLLDEDLRKFVLSYLAEPNLKEKSVRIEFNAKYKHQFDEAIHLMETNLLSFNEQKETIIQELVDHQDLVIGIVNSLCMNENLLDKEVLVDLLKNILRVYFKSNDYKMPHEEQPSQISEHKPEQPSLLNDTVNGQSALNLPPPQSEASVGQPTPQTDPAHIAPPGEMSHLNITGNSLAPPVDHDPNNPDMQRRGSFMKKVSPFPEITDEDKRIETLKKKLEVVFMDKEAHEQIPTVDAVFRIRESLNREDIRPEVKAQREEEKERIKIERAAIVDPMADFHYHKRQYLFDDYLNQVKKKEAEEKVREQQEEKRRKDEYIEQYYGDAYENEYKIYDFEQVDRPVTTVNENTQLTGDKKVLFIHRVNQGLYREAIFEKLRENFKDKMSLIKDMKIEKEAFTLDQRMEQEILRRLIRNKDQTPIFDVEL